MANLDIEDNGVENVEENTVKVKELGNRAEELYDKIDKVSLLRGIRLAFKLEQRVDSVEQFFLASNKQPNASINRSLVKDKEKMKHIPGFKKQQQDASCREAAAAKRMQELMRQFGSILRQITQHKWAWPFMKPVDVEGLGLRDYYEVIDRPMDFSTIKNQMEAKDGTGYKHVLNICEDVRLVFKNAMKYNDDTSNVHMMAKTLLEKFEEKWLQFLPRVTEEEKRREEEAAEAHLNMQHAKEAAHAKIARNLCNQIHEAEMNLEELREAVVQNCRKMTIQEKRSLGMSLGQLSHEDLSEALEIIAQYNTSIQATSLEINLDMGAQNESTLWRLRMFVKDALESRGKSSSFGGGKTSDATGPTTNKTNANINTTINTKRKKEIWESFAKTSTKMNKKAPS